MWWWIALALAHKPTFGGPYPDPANAHEVGDPDISIVVYQTVTCDQPEVWLSFVHTEPRELYVQLGVPEILRLEDYRPTVAVVSADLPPPTEALPFDIPDGYGAVVYDTTLVTEPEPFYEPFTQTSSWIVAEDTLDLPGRGRSYVVAWHPGGHTGKLWVALGTVEDFSDVDLTEFGEWNQQVHEFHETSRFDPAPVVEEEVCEVMAEPEGCGCRSGGSVGWMGLLALLGIRRARGGRACEMRALEPSGAVGP